MINEAFRMQELAGIDEVGEPGRNKPDKKELFKSFENLIKEGMFYLDEGKEEFIVGDFAVPVATFKLTHMFSNNIEQLKKDGIF